MDKLYSKIIKAVKSSTDIYLNKNYEEREDKHKFDNDDVTNRDIMTQDFLQDKFKKLLPGSRFVGEEGGEEKPENDYVWVVDPIDGTFNFKHDVPIYGTQICLRKNEKTIFSCLYLPVLNQTYYAILGKGAYLNGKQIKISDKKEVKNIGVCIGDFQVSLDIKKQKEIVSALNDKVKRIRMFGSSCFDSCQISKGSQDVYITHTITPWDLLPGDLLIREAGGVAYVNKDRTSYIYGSHENVLQVLDLLKNVDKYSVLENITLQDFKK